MRATSIVAAGLVVASAGSASADPVVPVEQLAIPYVLSLSQPAVDIKAKEGIRKARIRLMGPIFRSDPYDPPRPVLLPDGMVKMDIARLAVSSVKHRIVCEAKGTSRLRFVHERQISGNSILKVGEALADDAAFGTVDNQFAFDFFPASAGRDQITVSSEDPKGTGWQFGRCRVTAGLAPPSASGPELATPPLKSLAVLQTKPYRISAARPKVQVLTGTGAIRAGVIAAGGYVHFTINNFNEPELVLNANGEGQAFGGSISLIIARITPNKPHRIVCNLGGSEEFTFQHFRAKPGIAEIKSTDDVVPFNSETVKPDAKGLQSYDFFVGESGQDLIQLVPVTQKNFPSFNGCDVSLVP